MTRALVIEVDGSTRELDLTPEGGYQLLNEAVGGYIELVRLGAQGLPTHQAAFGYINEEGKMQGLPINGAATQLCRDTLLGGDFIAGPLVVVGPPDADGEETDAPEWVFDVAWSFPIAARAYTSSIRG